MNTYTMKENITNRFDSLMASLEETDNRIDLMIQQTTDELRELTEISEIKAKAFRDTADTVDVSNINLN